MKINEVIKEYRKKENLTQEQLATFLNVTAPAVNKWESGASYPDITLLGPLARILKIDINKLLSYDEDLSEEEIRRLSREVGEICSKEGFIKGFKHGEDLIKTYPGCDRLIFYVTTNLHLYLMTSKPDNFDLYKSKIFKWYEIAALSSDAEVSSSAAATIVANYINDGQYEKAQELLDKIPPLGYDKRINQALLYSKTDKKDEAFKLFEEMIFQSSNIIQMALAMIIEMLVNDENYDEAEFYADIAKVSSKALCNNEYNGLSAEMIIDVKKKDKERMIKILNKLADGIDYIPKEAKRMYKHLKFVKSNYGKVYESNLKKAIENENFEQYEFLRNDERIEQILKRLH